MILRGAPTQPVVVIRIDTQHDNAGDCLINRELVRLLAPASTIFLDLRACPPAFARQVIASPPGGKPWRRCRWPVVLMLLAARLRRRRCYLFLTPGGISGNGPGGPLPAWLHDLPLTLAAGLGVRICHVGASFSGLSPGHLARSRWRRRWLFRLHPRDSTSARYLERNGIRHDGCIPDLAFHLFDGRPVQPSVSAQERPLVCVSFRTDQYGQQAGDVAAATLALHRRLGVGLQWQPMVQVGRDRDGMERLRATLLEEGCAIGPLIDHHADPEACLEAYRGVSLVVSNRLHALLMAASQGARILAVVDGPGGVKLRGLLEDLGLGAAAVLSRDISKLSDEEVLGFKLDGRAQAAALKQAISALIQAA